MGARGKARGESSAWFWQPWSTIDEGLRVPQDAAVDFSLVPCYFPSPDLLLPMLRKVLPGLLVGVSGCLTLRYGRRLVRPDLLFSFDLVRAPSTRVTRGDSVLSALATWGGAAAFALGITMVFQSLGELTTVYFPMWQ